MDSSNIRSLAERQRQLSVGDEPKGDCVIYVMSRDVRVRDNYGLLLAQKKAEELGVPLAVSFCLFATSGKRSREHYQWLIEALKDVEKQLTELNIPLITLIGEPFERLSGLIRHTRPATVYFDYSPLKRQVLLREQISKLGLVSVYEVDSHNIVPVWHASDHQEYAARTIRPKILRQVPRFLEEPEILHKQQIDWPGPVMSLAQLDEQINTLFSELASNGQKALLQTFPPGEGAGLQVLDDFIAGGLINYVERRNDPSSNGLSGLSPYLHFGCLSSLRVVLELESAVHRLPGLSQSIEALQEEIIVRKELSDNYCHYNQSYDSLHGAPDWAQKTLNKHRSDIRSHMYTTSQFEASQTHDAAWNAAQVQLVQTGKMHGYMRMYWAKKVLEWSATPEDAHATLIYLNDHYSIDGGDPNGYVGILWSIAGLHDRPWGERSVYGTVRCMVYDGLKRKFDVKAYENQWNHHG